MPAMLLGRADEVTELVDLQPDVVFAVTTPLVNGLGREPHRTDPGH